MSKALVGLLAMAIVASVPCVALMALIRRIAPRMHGLLRGAIAVMGGGLAEMGLMAAIAKPGSLQAGLLVAIASLLPALFIGGGLCLPAVAYLSYRWRRREADLPSIFE